jgi:hypothetical protein
VGARGKYTYPRCACYGSVILYSTSWWLNTEWTHTVGSREDIEEEYIEHYYKKAVKKWRLGELSRFRGFSKERIWDGEGFVWRVKADIKD